MAKSLKLKTKDKELLASLKDFFRSILEMDEIEAILVPQRLPMKNMVMPTLVSDPDRLDGVDPLSPAFPMNAAKVVSKLTRKPAGAKIAAVLRPCEIRAFVELVKLKQGTLDDLVIIGMDCLGAFKNTDYFQFADGDGSESTQTFIQKAIGGQNVTFGSVELATASGQRPAGLGGGSGRKPDRIRHPDGRPPFERRGSENRPGTSFDH